MHTPVVGQKYFSNESARSLELFFDGGKSSRRVMPKGVWWRIEVDKDDDPKGGNDEREPRGNPTVDRDTRLDSR